MFFQSFLAIAGLFDLVARVHKVLGIHLAVVLEIIDDQNQLVGLAS